MTPLPQKNNASETDNANYTVDEMMDQLKKGSHQKKHSRQAPKGELITREDGTQVLKVRRRKRRSKQPAKKHSSHSQTNPKLKWAVLASIVALLVLAVVATIFIIAKFNGRKFKAKTESTISAISGAKETKLTQLRVTPVSARAAKTEITWGNNSFLKDAKFSNIRADIKATSFLSSHWTGEEILASKGTVHLQTPSSTETDTTEDHTSPYQFGAYRCNQLNLSFGSDKTSPIITNLMVSLRQLHNEQYQIVFQNGTLKLKNWPKLSLSSGIVTLNSDSASIEALLKATVSHNGELTIKGDIANNTENNAELSVKAKNYPIEELLGKNLGRLIKGELQGDDGLFSYDYHKKPEQALSFTLPFDSTDIHCEGFPMFKELAKLMINTSYNRPIFTQARGTLIRTNEGLQLNDLELINNSLMLVQGNIAVDSKKRLSGTLTIGIPESAFDQNPPAPFSGPRNGFYQIEVTLSGTAQTPNDNLHSLLKSGRKQYRESSLVIPKEFIKSPPLKTETPQPENGLGKPSEADFDALIR